MSAAAVSNGQTILLVDDEEHLRVTLRDFLMFNGYGVELARSAEQALNYLEQGRYDLVILDISMPGIGGMGFLQRVAHNHIEAPPILVLTARTNLQPFFDGLDVAGFVSKPCGKGVLLAEIQRILGVAKPVAAAAKAGESVHVLLGEDDTEMYGVIERLFARHGHRVTRALSGPGVLEAAPTARPDVVVMKQFLTKLNGSAVATLLRAMPSTKAIPIVLYDTVGIGEHAPTAAMAESAPVDDYVAVHEPSQILDAMERVIGML
jgi:DNA-binding response OmpR family regulator